MTKYIIAVSGGVDSVVLLHKLIQQGDSAVIAHFDHGIRDDSAEDAMFVKHLASQYGVPFEVKREELGINTSEDEARRRRYAFLKDITNKEKGTLVTAHHADDVIETIAINILRGTGWRGLAVFGDESIERPLVGLRKQELIEYAQMHNLSWREDSTNQSDKYLRNRIRRILSHLDDETHALLLQYWEEQVRLRGAIDQTVADHLGGNNEYSRYFFIHSTERAALELLRAVVMRSTGVSLTLPQRKKLLHEIKVARPASRVDAAFGVRIRFTKQSFIVEHPSKVV